MFFYFVQAKTKGSYPPSSFKFLKGLSGIGGEAPLGTLYYRDTGYLSKNLQGSGIFEGKINEIHLQGT